MIVLLLHDLRTHIEFSTRLLRFWDICEKRKKFLRAPMDTSICKKTHTKGHHHDTSTVKHTQSLIQAGQQVHTYTIPHPILLTRACSHTHIHAHTHMHTHTHTQRCTCMHTHTHTDTTHTHACSLTCTHVCTLPPYTTHACTCTCTHTHTHTHYTYYLITAGSARYRHTAAVLFSTCNQTHAHVRNRHKTSI